MYPDTNAPLTIAMCVKNQENKIIGMSLIIRAQIQCSLFLESWVLFFSKFLDQATSLEIRPGEALRYLFWVASNMKIGEEVMAYTTHHNAYGVPLFLHFSIFLLLTS